jgi:hypothetical protein
MNRCLIRFRSEVFGPGATSQVITASADQPGSFEEVQLGEATKLENTRTCLEAHRHLMELNKENVSKFQDVTTFLAKDLKRLEGGAP